MLTNFSWTLQEELRKPVFTSVHWYSLSQSESILILLNATAYYPQSFEVLFEWNILTPPFTPSCLTELVLLCSFALPSFVLCLVWVWFPLRDIKVHLCQLTKLLKKLSGFILFLCRGINPSLSFLCDQCHVISEYRWWRTEQINA